MEATLQALGQILLRAIPTFFLLILLHFYLKHIFFRPLRKILHQRYEATEGARQIAQQSLERAAAKTAEYETALRKARGEVYEAHDRFRKELQEQHESELRAARKEAEAAVNHAKADLAKDVEAAKDSLSRESELLANQIVESILRERVA
ncbi:MAG: ATP synthase F0 subunit B [Acidobacteriia bacterium]|nr:ATP synthase F0 subunit B [Terriglobia bacterium]